jgi:hypothetical protein
MSEREWALFLKDAEKSTNRIIEYKRGMNREMFFKDDRTFDAVMRNLAIIGEAIKHLPQSQYGVHIKKQAETGLFWGTWTDWASFFLIKVRCFSILFFHT